ncbi:hypothetical protein OROHE_018974 [Orobanche hederae]
MDRIHEELNEVKLEAEKLREECRAKNELYHSLRKAQAEQLAKSRQDKLEIDKLAQELNAKSEEIHEIRQMYEELQSSLQRKDLILQQISSANEKLRAEYSENFSKLECENRDLFLSLDQASTRIRDLEEKTKSSSEEIAGLKSLLSIKSDKSFQEVDKNASQDLKQRDEYILKLEEENRNFQNKIKWKNEQFSHLEEAHNQLLTQFQASKREWQKEKSSLIDDISNLQANLDAQLRVSENLETQLRLSNQALAHEESRRKVLEVELSESRSKFKNAYLDCQVAKSEIEELVMKRDEEIAELRMLLRKKETLVNEMNYKTAQLERENSELLVSLKDIQEAQINSNASSSSLKKLRNKLEVLEKLHYKCGVTLKEKEDKWNSRREKLTGDLKICLSELDGKDKSIRELRNELEDCQCLLEVKNEEIFVIITVLKSEFHVAYLKLFEEKEKSSMGRNMLLNQQLLVKNTKLDKVYAQLKEKCDEIAVLKEQVDFLDSLKRKSNAMEEELRKYKALLDESNGSQKHLLEYTANIEKALEMVNIQLSNRTSEIEKLKLEWKKSKSEMEILKLELEGSRQALKQENTSLLDVVKDKDAEVGKLQEQICRLESVISSKSEAVEILLQEKDSYIRLAEDRNCSIISLQDEIGRLKNKLAEREAANVAVLDSHHTLEQENKRLSCGIKEKDEKIQELQKEFESLIVEKKVMLDEALKTAEGRKIVEVEEKNQIIIDLEKEVNGLRNEVDCQGKSLIQSKQEVLQLEASLQTEKAEMQELRSQLVELESHKQYLLEDLRKACTDKENLVMQFEGILGKIGIICREDVELVSVLEKISHMSEEYGEPARDLLSSDGLDDTTFSSSMKLIQVSLDERTPLTELNS